MGQWDHVVEHTDKQFPFLQNLQVYPGDSDLISGIPDFVKVLIGIGCGLTSTSQSVGALAMILPRRCDTALWMCLGVALTSARAQIEQTELSAPTFRHDQILLLDGKFIVQFAGWTDIGPKVKFSGNDRVTLKRRESIRLQPVNTKRPLSRLTSWKRMQPTPLDACLGITTRGNRSIFRPAVILVTNVGRAEKSLRETRVRINAGKSQPVQDSNLLNLLCSGLLRSTGEIVPLGPGQIEMKPLLLIAPDLGAARRYLEAERDNRPLIALDGSRTFNQCIDVLADVVDERPPIAALIDREDAEDTRILRDQAFDVWTLGASELVGLDRVKGQTRVACQGVAFQDICESIRDFSRHEVVSHVHHDQSIERVWRLLSELISGFDRGNPELKEIEAELFRCFLRLARSVYAHPLQGEPSSERGTEHLWQIMSDHIDSLSDQQITSIQQLSRAIEELERHSSQEPPPKIHALLSELSESGPGPTAVILPTLDDISPATRYWRPRLTEEAFSRIEFCCPASLTGESRFGRAIVCGWLGEHRMRRLLSGCFAAQTVVLLYSFEERWLGRASTRWNEACRNTLELGQLAGLLGVATADLPSSPLPCQGPGGGGTPEPLDDIAPLELALRVFRRAQSATLLQSGEDTVEATSVSFADGYFIYLTPEHRVTVIDDRVPGGALEPGRLESRRVIELKPGDFVIFREGSRSDIIREMADGALARAGKRKLRETACLWRKALRENVGISSDAPRNGMSEAVLREAVQRLNAAGLDRHEATIRGWLAEDTDVIGPRSPEKDIPIIARVTGNQELAARQDEVCAAIGEVWGAHLSAASHLAHQLFAKLPHRLDGLGITSSRSVEIAELGRALVVRVEDVDTEATCVASSKANCLLRDED